MPSAPQTQDDWHQTSYAQICETIQKSSGHSLIIKAHPNDYLKRKSPSFFQGKHTWQVLAPTAVVLEPEDAYQCYKVCDVGISNSSSVSLEFPLFSKPFVYVDIDKSPVLAMHRPSWWWGDLPSPSFIGMITSADELSAVLDESQYEISDDAAYQAHVAKYFYQADGLAYQRIADVIEQAVEDSRPSTIMVRWFRGGSWVAQQRAASLGRYLVNPRRAIARFRR
jgi:CDP-glycerol glycerophosphotransferase (TagB/SpsB family)